MAATIRDVASHAGVSASTVFRALSKPDLVNRATLQRVDTAVRELGYEVNMAASRLSSGRTLSIGFIVPDLGNPLFAGVLKGAQARARAAGYSVFVADAEEEAVAEAVLVRAFARQSDGVVVCSARGDGARLAAMVEDVPLVLVHRPDTGVPGVSVDNSGGMEQAVMHLAALGHRRVAWVAGPPLSRANAEREAACRRAGHEHGVEVVEIGNFAPRYEGGVAAADMVLASRASGVIAYNDVVALGLLSRLHARGIAVPQDLSVVGFDDIPMTQMSYPALTTVSVPKEQMGRTAVDLMLGLLSGHDVRSVELPVQLVVRASTGVAAQG